MRNSNSLVLSALPGLLMLLSSCTTVDYVSKKIGGEEGETLKIQEIKYRKKGSIDSRLGRVGTFEGKSFQPFEQIRLPEGVQASPYEITLGEVESWGLGIVKDWIKGGTKSVEDKAGKYVILRADTVDLTRAMNTPQNEEILATMIRRKDPKVIVSMLTVVSDKTTITASDKITIFEDSSVNVEGSTEKTQQLGAGTPAAFSTANVCWEIVEGKPKVAQLTLDYDKRGTRSGCPDGSTDSTESIRNKLSK